MFTAGNTLVNVAYRSGLALFVLVMDSSELVAVMMPLPVMRLEMASVAVR